jgi:putative copper export protein
MIIEYLQPDASIWDGLTVVIRAGYYIASLGAAGLALFALGFGQRLTDEETRRLRGWLLGAVALAIALSLVAAVVRVQVLSAGELGNLAVWEAMFRSRIGDAFFIRMAGLLLLLPLAFGLRAGGGLAGAAMAGAGALMVIASYAAMGHSMLYRPRQELAAIVVVHLAMVAFWAGSLPPLAWVAARGGPDAAALMRLWSRAALVTVALLAASGVFGAALLVREPMQLLSSWYGNGMLAKLALVFGALALAAWHKLSLTPALEAHKSGAGAALARSIRIEMIVLALIFYAAAEMVSVHPTDLGHRIQG